jgi:hypothetical protein
MQFIAKRFNSSSVLADRSIPSIEFLVARMAISNMDITTGKLSTDIKILLLEALAAMLDSNVNEEANPRLVKSNVAKNSP